MMFLFSRCWVPQEFSSSNEEYVESVCWSANSYTINVNLPDEERMPTQKISMKFRVKS